MAYTLILALFLYLIVGFFLKIYKIEPPTLPTEAWNLIAIFAGAYAVSRGAEKVSANWTGNNVDNTNDTVDNSPPDDSDPEGDEPVEDDITNDTPKPDGN